LFPHYSVVKVRNSRSSRAACRSLGLSVASHGNPNSSKHQRKRKRKSHRGHKNQGIGDDSSEHNKTDNNDEEHSTASLVEDNTVEEHPTASPGVNNNDEEHLTAPLVVNNNVEEHQTASPVVIDLLQNQIDALRSQRNITLADARDNLNELHTSEHHRARAKASKLDTKMPLAKITKVL
jgi:hypothetical protein